MKTATISNIDQAETIQAECEREVQQLHGARYSGDRFVQPLHHHSFNTSHDAHQRDKIKARNY